jgi:hypothetical protein
MGAVPMIALGLDPGVHTGFATWSVTDQRFVTVTALAIHRAMEHVRLSWESVERDADRLLVIFEDARHHRVYGGRNRLKGHAVLQGVGSVKRDCSIWEGFLEDLGVPFIAAPPIRGGTKWNSATFARVSGWTKPTNNHARDAAVRVLNLNEPQARSMIREWRQRHPAV